MNKKDLCAAAGVAPRTIDRDVKAGLLAEPEHLKKNGSIVLTAEWSDDEARRYIDYRTGKKDGTLTNGNAIAVLGPEQETRIAKVGQDFLAELRSTLIDAAKEVIREATANGSKMPVVELKDKQVLSLKEAAKLSGIPAKRLIAAYRDGKLPGFLDDKRLGRGYRFVRNDLQGYTFRLSMMDPPEE